MEQDLLASEALVRVGVFLTVFVTMAAFELWSPRLERPELRGAMKSRRWLTNLSIVVISSVALRILFPAAAIGAALYAEARGFGLLRVVGLDGFVGGLIAFVILDFAIWLEHVASHKLPILWRIHRVHHADPGLDVTTALRFHPFEIVLSMAWKAVVVIALGAPVLSVLLFEIVLNASSMFNHSNVRLGDAADRILRRVIVTPDMHRTHHSTDPDETDSNYGFNFAFWDHIFATYTRVPKLGQDGVQIGLADFRSAEPTRLLWSLLLPFRPQDRRRVRRS